MEKLLKTMQKDMELAKIVFGEDKEAAYEAANAIEPCDKAQFEEFYNENRAKSSAIAKVLQKAASDEEYAKIIYGEDRKAAYEAAQKVASGYTADEFEDVCKILVAVALKVLNKDNEKLSDEELDQVAGGGWVLGTINFLAGAATTVLGFSVTACAGPLGGAVGIVGAGFGLETAVSSVKEVYNDIKNTKSFTDLAISVAKDSERARKTYDEIGSAIGLDKVADFLNRFKVI